VFQCIYSQCDASHFGSALHFTISQCAGIGGHIVPAMPLIPDHDSLRRREAQYLARAELYGSGSAMLPAQSSDFLFESAIYATQSVAGPYAPDAPLQTAPHFPLQTGTAPAPPSKTEIPVLFTGKATEFGSCSVLYVLVSVLSLYLAF
jgi:hypothetical protein